MFIEELPLRLFYLQLFPCKARPASGGGGGSCFSLVARCVLVMERVLADGSFFPGVAAAAARPRRCPLRAALARSGPLEPAGPRSGV